MVEYKNEMISFRTRNNISILEFVKPVQDIPKLKAGGGYAILNF